MITPSNDTGTERLAMHNMRITAVEIVEVQGPLPDTGLSGWTSQVHAASIYEDPSERNHRRMSAVPTITARYLRIGTSGDVEGFYGPIDLETLTPILGQIAPRLIGRDPLAVTVLWDMLARVDRHAAQGHYRMAVSAVDNALWDLRGRVFGAPVWQLLGGSLRDSIPAYASMLGTSLELDIVKERVVWAKSEGFSGQKWFLGDGPATGESGLRRNVEIARTVRDAIGEYDEMMFDVFRGWNLAYAKAWTKRVEELVPTWLEEPFLPMQLAAYAELHRYTSVPLAMGEHFYDRSAFVPYLDRGILAVAQADPEWCGGVTELVRIGAMAELSSVPLIAHGHNIHAALHVAASQSPLLCPKVEYLVNVVDIRHHFEVDPPRAVGGRISLPTRPGFGIMLDDVKVEKRSIRTS